ncbi:MAG: hypothetical protein JWN46_97 [Acidimicrobiales bacterium]|nr:hypothetical protein [Acidimicrobiales bacterium]
MSAQPFIALPQRADSRDEARTLLHRLPTNLHGVTVTVDGSSLAATGVSFVDELIKVILELRGADRLVLRNIADRPARFARAAAQRRGVDAKVDIRPIR